METVVLGREDDGGDNTLLIFCERREAFGGLEWGGGEHEMKVYHETAK